MKFLPFVFALFLSLPISYAQEIPDVYAGFKYDDAGQLYYSVKDQKYYATPFESFLTLDNLKGHPKGDKEGLKFDFGDSSFKGSMYYGLINFNDSKYPTPVWYKKKAKIKDGKAYINIKKRLSGIYDMSDWEKAGIGTLGYRVTNKKGKLLYDGVISFHFSAEKGFEVATTITEGPFVNNLDANGATIWFETNKPIVAEISVNGRQFHDVVETTQHEIIINGLQPNTQYDYTVHYKDYAQSYSFHTAPKDGTRQPFVFAYVSDSRAGKGGGERDLGGTNFYAMRKIAALANFNKVSFMQFTGDLVNGYALDKKEINVEYANWKRAIEPFGHYFPIIAAQGNHEAVGMVFRDGNGKTKSFVDKFPFQTESCSAVFAQNFVNPLNGPRSEDGAYYDPNPDKVDFPPYDETVFYYTYDNVAVIVLNSNYFYAPTITRDSSTGGNLHGYIMDQQLKWLKKTVDMFENDEDIDHVFVTQHTPTFPNSAHTKDDMWYSGNNGPRPTIAGKPVKKGIIERRDEYLDILVNHSTKVVAMLTGDEHNYNKVKITPDVNIYPNIYPYPKLERKRTIWQINNGSAGAPYYAQDKNVPWTNATSNFSTQFALVLIYVDGQHVSARVFNPDTLELMDEWTLK
ncbi:MAG TPA: metallophosphoesterase family protein [Saprospiraceae bacterium]|nr:metallophosphoesterase family protein [Saprospiraceae bacterium]